MGSVIAVMVVLTIFNVFVWPWLFYKKYIIHKPYYAVSIGVTAVLFVLNLIFKGSYSFILIMLYIIGPAGAVVLADHLLLEGELKAYEKKRDFSGVYDWLKVWPTLHEISNDGLGFLRFRMDGIWFKKGVGDRPEEFLYRYTRPLANETELKRLVDHFVENHGNFRYDTDGEQESEWFVQTAVRHDDKGPYLFLVVYECDHGVPYLLNAGDAASVVYFYTRNDTDTVEKIQFRRA